MDTKQTVDLSIIIPTFERSDLLYYGLKSISEQNIQYNYEILVINDGTEDNTKQVCNTYSNLPIKYIFSGHRNKNKKIWRIPGFPINIGIKKALGEHILIMCPEIYALNNCINEMIEMLNKDPNLLLITSGIDDRGAVFLTNIQAGVQKPKLIEMFDNYLNFPNTHLLNTDLPFFLMLNKQKFIDIGGYDEDFIGFCWDDNDIVERLLTNGGKFYKMKDKKIIHLFHPRIRYDLTDKHQKWLYNKKIYEDKKNIVKRNQNREWGTLDES